jgi:hypothetical protein
MAGTACGTLVSTDSGAAWPKVTPGLIYSLAFDPLHANLLYAGRRDGQVLRSPLSGGAWQPFNTGLTADVPVTGLVVNAARPPVLYAAHTWGVYSMKIPNPFSFLSELSPTSRTLGDGDFTLTVTGSGFTAGAVVKWGSTDLVTNFVSSTQLTALVPESMLSAGQVNVSVVYPGVGVDATNALTFAVNNPVPALSGLTPGKKYLGAEGFKLLVTGTGFINGAVVKWGGASLTTTYISSTQLFAAVPDQVPAAAGEIQVTVANPAPGGGESGPLTFTYALHAAYVPVIRRQP